MSAKNWCFTINNPTAEDAARLSDCIALTSSNDSFVGYIVYQSEAGSEGTPHYQGYIQCRTRKTLRQIKQIVGDRAHLEVARGKPEQNKDYCTKEPRLDGPWEAGTIAAGQGTRNDINQFVEYIKSNPASSTDDVLEHYPGILAKYPRFVATVTSSVANAQRNRVFNPRPGWQTSLSEHLTTEPNSRTVRWYYDQVGNAGKSYFSINYNRDGRFGYIVGGGKHADIYYGYKRERVVFFDWSRDNQDSFPYGVVENFKNGYFLSTKYEVQAVVFPSPHVVVFANFHPDLSKLSSDRWDIITL